MMDQAQSLRNLMSSKTVQAPKSQPRSAKFITITSGKGGVGKSNFTLNFALALQRLGRKVLVFDADIGMANIDVLMGVRSKFNLSHLLSGEKQINEIIEKDLVDSKEYQKSKVEKFVDTRVRSILRHDPKKLGILISSLIL